MSIRVITNTVYGQTTEDIQSDVTATLEGAPQNLTFGPRYLGYKFSVVADDDHFYYKRGTSNQFRYDTIVMAGAHNLDGQEYLWIGYDGTTTTTHETVVISSSNLTGINNEDYISVLPAVITGQRLTGIRISAPLNKSRIKLNKLYIGESFVFDYPVACSISRVNRYSSVTVKRQPFKFIEQASLTFERVPSADFHLFENLYRVHSDACFIYDENADFLRDKLWHVIIGQVKVNERFNDLYTVTLPIYRLRNYPQDDISG